MLRLFWKSAIRQRNFQRLDSEFEPFRRNSLQFALGGGNGLVFDTADYECEDQTIVLNKRRISLLVAKGVMDKRIINV